MMHLLLIDRLAGLEVSVLCCCSEPLIEINAGGLPPASSSCNTQARPGVCVTPTHTGENDLDARHSESAWIWKTERRKAARLAACAFAWGGAARLQAGGACPG